MVFDPRNDLEGFDLTRSDFDCFSALDFQIQQVTIFSAEDIEVKEIANFKILAPSEVHCRDGVNGIGRLIEFVLLYLASFVTMNRPFLRVTVELRLGVDDLLVFPFAKGETGRGERLRRDG